MRVIFSIIFLLAVLGTDVLAQNSLWIQSDRKERFYVYLDGTQYNDSAKSDVFISGLAAKKYKVKIRFLKKSPELQQVISLGSAKQKCCIQFGYTIFNNNGQHTLEWDGETPLPMEATETKYLAPSPAAEKRE